MKYLLHMMVLLTPIVPHTIFEFNKNTNIQDWMIVDDIVMGGRSSGTFEVNTDGNGVFSGKVSLENNGGFSSLRYAFAKTDVTKYTSIKIRMKGDGKRYQLRIKNDPKNYYSYISYFQTNNEWQQIEIPLKDMFPSFREGSWTAQISHTNTFPK